MGLSKYRINADHDSIASWLSDGAGNALTSTGNALDVNIKTADVALEVELSHINDSVSLGDGTNLYTSTTVGADIGLDVNLINASIEVTGTDFDIRDLAFATDSVTAHQGGTWVIDSITNDVNVTATDLDIRNLVFADDKVDVSGSNVNAAFSGFASGAYGNNSVTGASAIAITAGTSGRDKVLLQNRGNDCYIGFDNSVTAANGVELEKGGSYEMEVSDGVTLFAFCPTGTADIRYQELVA